jgi:hypothetical protein
MKTNKLIIAPLLGLTALGGGYVSESDYRTLREDFVTNEKTIDRYSYEEFTRVRNNQVLLSRNSEEEQDTLDGMYEDKKARFGLLKERIREKEPVTLYDEQVLLDKIVATEYAENEIALPQIEHIPTTLEEFNQIHADNLNQ